jgi:competence protein ComFB
MKLTDHYDFGDLKNATEDFVLEELGRQLEGKKNDLCLCDDCILDMACYALNHVSPRYRISLLGSLYTGLHDDQDYIREIREAVSEAVSVVSKNPSHD